MVSRSLTGKQAVVLGLAVVVGVGLAAVGLAAIASQGWFGANAFTVRAGFPAVRGVEWGGLCVVAGYRTPANTVPLGPAQVTRAERPDRRGCSPLRLWGFKSTVGYVSAAVSSPALIALDHSLRAT